MQIKIGDIIGVGLASLLLFPLVFLAVLFGTGTAHIEVGEKKATLDRLAGYLERHKPEQMQSDAEQNKLFEANLRLKEDLERRQEELRKEAERIENLKIENARIKEDIGGQKKKIEEMVQGNQKLSDQRVEELAQIYGAMKPVEAAPILMNLEDTTIARILKRVPETRSQAKLLAALGAMDNNRAATITSILGWRKEGT